MKVACDVNSLNSGNSRRDKMDDVDENEVNANEPETVVGSNSIERNSCSLTRESVDSDKVGAKERDKYLKSDNENKKKSNRVSSELELKNKRCDNLKLRQDCVENEQKVDKDLIDNDNKKDRATYRIEDVKNDPDSFNKYQSLSFEGTEEPSLSPKTEGEQLIKNVQHFYPEIEFSKTVNNIIQEGKAYIIKQSKNVFYNPVQEFNRDLSVLAISIFSEEHENDPRCRLRGTKRKAKDNEGSDPVNNSDSGCGVAMPGVKCGNGIVILEALSATGLRSIRYAKEVPGVKEIVANDISVAAVEAIKKNIEYNSVGDLVTTSHNDASLLMYMRKAQGNFFDVIDLDPYGCPSRFLDSAVQCVRDGGLLLITCTDMAVLAGNSPETCYVKYGAISLRNPACHEMALRIALQCIESHSNRYGRYIVPQLSFSADFYIRVIVKVYTSPAMCKKTTSKLVMLYQCVGCQALSYWPLGLTEQVNNSIKHHLPRGPPVGQDCTHCGSQYYQGGPVWSGQLHDNMFVEKMLSQIDGKGFVTEKRMEGMLELIKEELPGTLLYYTIDSLCSKVHCEVIPRNKFVSAIFHAGYKVTLSHAAPNSMKTNAPAGVIWDIIRCWVQEHPVNPKRLSQKSVAERLLSVIPRLKANFSFHPEVMAWNKKKILRYQQNPQPFWGPGTRDKNNFSSGERMSKSFMNQNKKCKRVNTNKDKAQMKAKINSKNIDIIEVVTITDDTDEEIDDSRDNSYSFKCSNVQNDINSGVSDIKDSDLKVGKETGDNINVKCHSEKFESWKNYVSGTEGDEMDQNDEQSEVMGKGSVSSKEG